MSSLAGFLPAALITGLLVASCGSADAPAPSDDDGAPIRFVAPPGTPSTEVGAQGRLAIDAGCIDASGQSVLSVGARTTAAKARIESSYWDTYAGRTREFQLKDFGREFGGWDFKGSIQGDAHGTLTFSAPGEKRVLEFEASDRPSGCRFVGAFVDPATVVRPEGRLLSGSAIDCPPPLTGEARTQRCTLVNALVELRRCPDPPAGYDVRTKGLGCEAAHVFKFG